MNREMKDWARCNLKSSKLRRRRKAGSSASASLPSSEMRHQFHSIKAGKEYWSMKLYEMASVSALFSTACGHAGNCASSSHWNRLGLRIVRRTLEMSLFWRELLGVRSDPSKSERYLGADQ